MTPQHPAAPETETDARGRLAERLTWAVEKCCQCTDGHHDWPANPYGTEGDVRMSRDDARMIVSLLADLDALRERVRVVEGERDEWKATAWEVTDLVSDLTARAESTEAAHVALVAGVARRVGDYAEEPHSDECGMGACVRCVVDEFAALLAGGGA